MTENVIGVVGVQNFGNEFVDDFPSLESGTRIIIVNNCFNITILNKSVCLFVFINR